MGFLLQLAALGPCSDSAAVSFHLLIFVWNKDSSASLIESYQLQSIGCSSRGPGSIPSTHMEAQNLLLLQFLNALLLASVGTACIWYTDILAGRTFLHIKLKKKIN